MWMRSSAARAFSSRSVQAAALAATAAVAATYLHASFTTPTQCDASKTKTPALSPQGFRAFPVSAVETLTHNTKRITLKLPHADDEMGLTPASCVLVKAPVDGTPVVRPYTPTNLNEERGRVELVVKSYPNGKLSKRLCALKVGDQVEIKGPMLKFKYEANQYKHIGMIAGGTGITPMLQLIQAICRNPKDNTKVTLICANVTEQDMLLKDELDKLQAKYPQLEVHHVLSAPSNAWKGHTGFVSSRMVYELMPSPEHSDILICVSGPPGMMQHLSGEKAPDYSQGELKGILQSLGYNAKQVFKF